MTKRKHMKASAVKVKIEFYGKRPELKLVFPENVARQLYRRLRARFEDS
jgi:hypothetical protein